MADPATTAPVLFACPVPVPVTVGKPVAEDTPFTHKVPTAADCPDKLCPRREDVPPNPVAGRELLALE